MQITREIHRRGSQNDVSNAAANDSQNEDYVNNRLSLDLNSLRLMSSRKPPLGSWFHSVAVIWKDFLRVTFSVYWRNVGDSSPWK